MRQRKSPIILNQFKSKFFSALFLLLPTICFPSQFGYGQIAPKPDAGALALNESVEDEIKPGQEARLYRLTLAADQYASIIIEQKGVNVAARTLAPGGQILNDFDWNASVQGLEKIELVAAGGGNYLIEIRARLPKAGFGKYSIRLSETRAATDDEKLLDLARRNHYQSLRLQDAGNFDEAIKLANLALETQTKIMGADDHEASASMLTLSRLYLAKNNLAQAENFARRAIEATAKTFGADSLNYADALTTMARLRFVQANYAESETLYRQALNIREKAAGADSFPVADSSHHLALLYRATSDYPKAEQNFLKALTICENLFGADHFETARILVSYGLFYYGAGDFDKAYALLQRALAINEKLFPPNHRQIGIALNNLGLVAWKKRDYDKAKAYYLRALNIFEIVNGPDSDGVANILGNLAVVYKEADGDLLKAEEYFKRALVITEKNFGENHFSTANSVSSLAIIYRAAGDYERAEQFGLRALAINERVLGEYNHYTMLAIGSLLKIYAAKGDTERAVHYLKRLAAIHEKVIPLNLRIGSERQKIAYYRQTSRFDNTITMHAEVARNDATMRDLAVTTILQHKGRVLDAVSDSLSALRRRFNADDQKLLDDLNEVNSRLSRVILSNRQKMSAEQQQKEIKTLEDERERLESEISRRSAGFYESSQAVTLKAVRAEIPSDAVLVEFAVYRPSKWKSGVNEPEYGEPRYIAYLLRREGETQWRDLGDVKTINEAIHNFRQVLRDPKRKDTTRFARVAYEKILQPIRTMLGDATQLLVAPDGELNLIPFGALIDEKGQYLVKNYSLAYLTSGRDLLRMRTRRESKSQSLIVANPSFGNAGGEQTNLLEASKKTTERDKNFQSVTATRNLSDAYFAPLAGTLVEARSIQTLFPDWMFLTGTEASESSLKQRIAPSILHIATHGFFLQNLEADTNSQPATGNSSKANQSENPLLRSGLALAGANQRSGDKEDDGILTALETSGLNLWGTKLVVLSACDTGLGEARNGEGIYGLRRAFVLAGVESQVMSLWAVSDLVTREIMTDFYKNLKNGMGRGAALRQVQLEMLKKPNRQHPFYWAAFIESGEWANLDGIRR